MSITTITVDNQTEQDAEYQVTPGPPTLPGDLVEGGWLPILPGQFFEVESELPAAVFFRNAQVTYFPTVVLPLTTPNPVETNLTKIGTYYVVVVP